MNRKSDLLAPLFRKLSVRGNVAMEERRALLDAASEPKELPAGRAIVREGDRPSGATLVAHGLAARVNVLGNGGRTITAFHIAGDFVDLHSSLLEMMDHTAETLTRVVIVHFPHSALRRMTEKYPKLARLLWLSTLIDSAVDRRRLIVSGRMPALNHMAHLFMEHLSRARLVGTADRDSCDFPVKQADLADAMGISAVHVNRTLQDLRARNMVEWQNGRLRVLDEAGLRHLAEFDDTFLHLERDQRSSAHVGGKPGSLFHTLDEIGS